jgi:hypothetical protein
VVKHTTTHHATTHHTTTEHSTSGSRPEKSGSKPKSNETPPKPSTRSRPGEGGGRGAGFNADPETVHAMSTKLDATAGKLDSVAQTVGGVHFDSQSLGLLGSGAAGDVNNGIATAHTNVTTAAGSVRSARDRTTEVGRRYQQTETDAADALNKTVGDIPDTSSTKASSASPSSSTTPPSTSAPTPHPTSSPSESAGTPTPGSSGPPGDRGGSTAPSATGSSGKPPPQHFRDAAKREFTPSEQKELDTVFHKMAAKPKPGEVPGSGQLTQRERELVVRAQKLVTITPDTMMQKVIQPGQLDHYLGNMKYNDERGRFDSNVVGGFVARAQDGTHLRTPRDLIQGNRLDYPGTTFDDKFKASGAPVHVMEFPAGDTKYSTPLGAPYAGGSGQHENWTSVTDSADRMTAAAESQGLDPRSYYQSVNKWPYSGVGFTADAQMGLPERVRPYGAIEPGSVIYEYDASGSKTPVARYTGDQNGWEDLR